MINLILHSNLFNFAIFMLIIIIIANKVDIPAILDKLRTEIVDKIDASHKTKTDAEKALQEAQISASNTENEIKEIMDNAQTTSQAMKLHIVEEANSKVQSIAKNSKSIIENEEKQIASNLVSKLGKKSVTKAQDYITNELKANPDLHYRFLDESINGLEKAVL